jgi:signal transduction histidine kinase
MNLVSFLDLLASVFLLYGLVVLVRAMVKGRRVYVGLAFLVTVFLFNSIPNFIEWIGYEQLIEPFEDYFLILLPAGFFLFFSVAVFAESEQGTTSRNKVFMALHSITENVVLTDKPHDLWQELLGRVVNVMGFNGGFIHFPEEGDLVSLRFDWEGADQLRNQVELIDAGETILSEVLMTRKPVVVQHTHNMPDSFIQALYVSGVHSVALFPVYSETRVLGVMGIISQTTYNFSHEEVDLFSLLGHHFGEIILNSTLLNETRGHSRQLSGALSARQHFLTIITDDLKDPLLRIRTVIQRLSEDTLAGERDDLSYMLAEANADSEKLEKLIDDVRELSLLDSGDMILNLIPGDARKEAARLVDQLQERARKKDIKLVVDAPDNLPPVEMDKDLFRSALRHLVSNAIKYTPDQGTVTVSVAGENDKLLLKIADTGIGIEEVETEKVFDMFYRTSTARQSEKTGTGLGLTIVRKIVELHQGDITFESVKGEGTTFIVRIPRIQMI